MSWKEDDWMNEWEGGMDEWEGGMYGREDDLMDELGEGDWIDKWEA